MTKLLSSSRRVVFALRMKVFTNTILEHHSQTIFKKSVCILRASSRQKFKLTGPWKEYVCIICRLFRHLSMFVPSCKVETPKSNWQSKHKSFWLWLQVLGLNLSATCLFTSHRLTYCCTVLLGMDMCKFCRGKNSVRFCWPSPFNYSGVLDGYVGKLLCDTLALFPGGTWPSCTLFLGPFTLQPRLGAPLVGCGLVHRHLQSGPDLNQNFDIIIAPSTSSVCYMLRLQLCVPDRRWCTMKWEQCSAVLQSRP